MSLIKQDEFEAFILNLSKQHDNIKVNDVALIINFLKTNQENEIIKFEIPTYGMSQVIILLFCSINKYVIKYQTDNNTSRDIQLYLSKYNRIIPYIKILDDRFYIEEFREGTPSNFYSLKDRFLEFKESVKKINELPIENIRTNLSIVQCYYNSIKEFYNYSKSNVNALKIGYRDIDQLYAVLEKIYYKYNPGMKDTTNPTNQINDESSIVCHCDLNTTNIMETKDTFHIIDYEFCSIHHKYYDFVSMYELVTEEYYGQHDHELICQEAHVFYNFLCQTKQDKDLCMELRAYIKIFWLFWVEYKLAIENKCICGTYHSNTSTIDVCEHLCTLCAYKKMKVVDVEAFVEQCDQCDHF